MCIFINYNKKGFNTEIKFIFSTKSFFCTRLEKHIMKQKPESDGVSNSA